MGEPETPLSIPDRVELVEFGPLFFVLAGFTGYAAGFASGGFGIGIMGGLVGAGITALLIAAASDAPPLLWNGIVMLTSGLAGGMGGAHRASKEAFELELASMPTAWMEQIAKLLAERSEVRSEWLEGIPEAQRLNALRVFARRHQHEVNFRNGVIWPRVDYPLPPAW